eukprot:1136239-Pelagomonas_calceolata.AAC.7
MAQAFNIGLNVFGASSSKERSSPTSGKIVVACNTEIEFRVLDDGSTPVEVLCPGQTYSVLISHQGSHFLNKATEQAWLLILSHYAGKEAITLEISTAERGQRFHTARTTLPVGFEKKRQDKTMLVKRTCALRKDYISS